jgi:hypothetical protein
MIDTCNNLERFQGTMFSEKFHLYEILKMTKLNRLVDVREQEGGTGWW